MEKGTIIILVLIGLLLGLALIGSELVNPFRGLSNARAEEQENAWKQPINEAAASATVTAIEAQRAFEPTRQAGEHIQDKEYQEQLRNQALENRLEEERNNREMKRIVVITICAVFFFAVSLGAILVFKSASARIERQEPALRYYRQPGFIPATGGPQQPSPPPQTNPVDAAERRFRSGRSDGHSHSGLPGTAPAPDDSSEPKYPFAI